MDFDAYVEGVRIRLVGAGFRVVGDDEPDVELRAHRRQVKVTRFGFVNTVVTVSRHLPGAGVDELRTFAERALRPALKLSGPLPRGLGSSLVAYLVLVVDQASPELREFVAGYAPKHWAALEFPVVVELVSNSLIVFEKTPFWGSAYYKRTRADARELLTPT